MPTITTVEVQNPKNTQQWIPLASDDVEAIDAQATQHNNIAILQEFKLDSASLLSSFLDFSDSDDGESKSAPASKLVFCFDLEIGIAVLVTNYQKHKIVVTPFRYLRDDSTSKTNHLPSIVRRPQSYALGHRVIELIQNLEKSQSKDRDYDEEDQSHCHKTGQKFGFFRWRHKCTGCKKQYCSSCCVEGNGVNKGLLCDHCSIFYEHNTSPIAQEACRIIPQAFHASLDVFYDLRLHDAIVNGGSSAPSNSNLSSYDIDARRAEPFTERTTGEREIAYLLPYFINVARLEEDERNAQKVCEDYADLINNIVKNKMWMNDVARVMSNKNTSSFMDKAVALRKIVIAAAQEAGVFLCNKEVCDRTDNSVSSCAMYLISYKEKLGNGTEVYQRLDERMKKLFKEAVSTIAAVDFTNETDNVSPSDRQTRQRHGVFDVIELLKNLKKEYFDAVSSNSNSNNSSSGLTFQTLVDRICKKLQSIGAAFNNPAMTSQDSDFSSHFSVDSWQRELCRSFFKETDILNSVVGIYLYTLEDLPLYRMLNEALRHKSTTERSTSYSHLRNSATVKSVSLTSNKNKRSSSSGQNNNNNFVTKILEPLRLILENFLNKMPGHPRVVFRGQSYRVAESLDDDADSFALINTTGGKNNNNKDTGGASRQMNAFVPLQQFTSTTTDFNIAHDLFLQGNRAGSFLIYISYNSISIGQFSSFEAESEVLLPAGLNFEVVHRVPLAHLSIMDQRFDVVCLQDCTVDQGFGGHYVTANQRVALALEAQRAVSNAYREITKFFVAPTMKEIIERPKRGQEHLKLKLLDAVDVLLDKSKSSSSSSNPSAPFKTLAVNAIAGMGKTSLSIFLQSVINDRHLHGYNALLVSLPALPQPHKTLFDPEDTTIEKFLLHRLKLPTSQHFLDLLRKEKLFLILDSLDEVPLANWPTDKPLFSALQNNNNWPNLKMVLTCRGEHLTQHRLSMETLFANQGKTFTIEPFESDEIDRLTNIWLPGAGEVGTKIRETVKFSYQKGRDEFKTPFALYLLVKAYGAQLLLRRGHSFPATAQELLLAQEQNNNNNNNNQRGSSNSAAADQALNQRWESDRLILQQQQQNNVSRFGGRGGENDTNDYYASGDFLDDSNITTRLQQGDEIFNNTVQRANRGADNMNQQQEATRRFSTDETLPWNTSTSDQNSKNKKKELEDICDIYEEGIKALIAQNAEHLYRDVSDDDMKRIVEDVFEWSQLLAVLMLSDTNLAAHSDKLSQKTSTIDSAWKSSLGEEELSSVLFYDECQRWYFDDPTVLIMLAPMRLSGYSPMSHFEFRHKSIHEFLLAHAMLKSSNNSRITLLAREIDITRHPNASLFYSIMVQKKATNAIPAILDETTSRKIKVSQLINNIFSSSSSSSSSSPPRLALHKIYFENDVGNVADAFNSASHLFLEYFSRLTHVEVTCGSMVHNAVSLEVIKAIIQQIIKHSSPIECIVFDHPELGDDTLEPFFSSSSPAVASTLRQIALPRTKVSIESIKALVVTAQTNEIKLDLHSLDFSGCTDSSLDIALFYLGDTTRSTYQYVLRNLRFFSIAETNTITDSSLAVIFDKVPNLHAVNLSGAMLPELDAKQARNADDRDRKQHALTHLCINSRELRSVDFSYCGLRFSSKVGAFTKTCANLVRFIAHQNTNVLFPIAHSDASELKARQLTIFEANYNHIYGGDEMIEKLVSGMPRLMTFRARGARITNFGINLMARHLLPGHLRCLEVGSPDTMHSDSVYDSALCNLLRMHPSIRSLDVSRQEKLSSDFLQTLEEVTELTGSLRFLSVSGLQSNGITDRYVSGVIKNNPNLRALDISLSEVSDSTLIEISNYCLDFRWAVIRMMRRRCTDSGVTAIATKCKNLRFIDMDDCLETITDDSVTALSKNSKKLEVVKLDSSDFTLKGIEALIAACPRLRVISCRRKLPETVQSKCLLLEDGDSEPDRTHKRRL